MSLKNEPLTFTKSQIRVLSFLFFLEKRGRRRKMKPTSVSRMKKFPFTHKQHLQWSSRASSLRSRIFYSSSYLSRTFPTSSSIPPPVFSYRSLNFSFAVQSLHCSTSMEGTLFLDSFSFA